MPINPVSGKIEAQKINDNLSYLETGLLEKANQVEVDLLAGKAANVLSDPYFSRFPNQSTGLTTNFGTDALGDLIATSATTTLHYMYTSVIAFEEFVQLSFKINVEKAKNFGAMIGFRDSSGNRLLFGYEPAYSNISAYYTPNGFKAILASEKVKDGEYTFVFKKFKDGSMTITVNGTEYNVKSFYSSLTFNFDRVYIQLKTTDLGLKVSNLNLSYLQTSFQANDMSVKKLNDYGKKAGRNVHIYKFGGKGNDWCFVRTPANYNPQGKAHPFVIANHGNGWVMDGTESKANWTKRTMYVNSDDPDYIANPSQYNLVPADKPELLYSNPTIEALLDAGYVVCGAQNYDDNLYGNTNNRNAMQDFFFHMIKNYNVEEKCFMIGASNGAMTSLNGMYLLGGVGRVKAMILQYPLTSLWRHYTNYADHQAPIETAYGIPAGLSEADFEKATRTHDPEKVNTVVIGTTRIKTTALPPIKFYYSYGDTITHPDNNSTPLMQVLENSNFIYEGVQASGGHGDYTHFDPTAYVAWFEKYR